MKFQVLLLLNLKIVQGNILLKCSCQKQIQRGRARVGLRVQQPHASRAALTSHGLPRAYRWPLQGILQSPRKARRHYGGVGLFCIRVIKLRVCTGAARGADRYLLRAGRKLYQDKLVRFLNYS